MSLSTYTPASFSCMVNTCRNPEVSNQSRPFSHTLMTCNTGSIIWENCTVFIRNRTLCSLENNDITVPILQWHCREQPTSFSLSWTSPAEATCKGDEPTEHLTQFTRQLVQRISNSHAEVKNWILNNFIFHNYSNYYIGHHK